MKRLITLFLASLIAFPVHAGQWAKAKPLSTDQWTAFPTDNQANNDALDRVLAGHREGMAISYTSASAVSVAAGEIVVSNSDGSVRLMLRNTAATSVGWSDIDTGSEASATTYYIYAIATATSDETATFKISTNSSAPTGITYYKRLGSFYNDASSNITQIVNDNGKQYRDWSSKSIGSSYQATTDIIAVGYIDCGYYGELNAAGYLFAYSDSSSTPTTARAYGGCDVDSSGATGKMSRASTISIPVKAGDYYKFDVTNVRATPRSGLAIVPNY